MTAVLRAAGFKVRARPADVAEVEEDADTLEGNALLKARAMAAAVGLPAVADDTGLFVDALNGRPGVRSARYAGPRAAYADNVARLLGELAAVPAPRRAHFRTVVALAHPDGSSLVVEGVLAGQVTETPRGGGGFGYDSVFEADETPGQTLAELSPEAKNRFSHRGRALAALAAALAVR
ncbi:MAG: RdgB/HAM1 family non-canonical purine NTP pyrophosphatase [Acidimicrobiales bacterium]